MNRVAAMCAAILCLITGMAHARDQIVMPPARLLTMDCIVEAAQGNEVPLAALVGILAAENGKTGEALRNTNGTWDLGVFQVNSTHIVDLLWLGIAPEAILLDGCVNAHAAAWLLRREYERTGDIWAAVGAYHSRTPHLNNAYVGRVKKHLARLKREGFSALPAREIGR